MSNCPRDSRLARPCLRSARAVRRWGGGGRRNEQRSRLKAEQWLLVEHVGRGHDPNGWVAGLVADTLSARYKKRLPTMIVSNLTLDELAEAVDRSEHGRTWDRLEDASLVNILIVHKYLTSVRPKLGDRDE